MGRQQQAWRPYKSLLSNKRRIVETKAVRIFYRKSDNQIVWHHELRGTGEFPTTIDNDLAEIPSKIPDGIMPLGGIAEDYGCIEEQDSQKACDFLNSDESKIVDERLVIGPKRVVPAIYRYEAFTKKVIHPKREAPIYVGYEVLEFDQKLTPMEISELKTQLGKTIRRLE